MNKARKAPSTLFDRLIADENERHAGRLREIKSAEARLRMLEPTFNALEARGVRISMHSTLLNCYDKSLHITRGGTSSFDHALYDAMIDLGFTEIERRKSLHYAYCTLKKGRLLLKISVEAQHGAKVDGGAA